ncbi:outer membrane beta-barrel protein [Flavobacterium sp.]|uniref:outer membrane beta-barrel protein n=1 Tax=Flavobacterium sp. TaxID=239 RepID=UPI002616CC11|nr:outer membrane beta-barrel protein [Flavobacterium sp.]
MKERKNIDRLFQEKFKDFEQIPDPVVWENIEHALLQKKKRRVIPIWWKLAGTAAILIPMIFGLQLLFTNNSGTSLPVSGNESENGMVAKPSAKPNTTETENPNDQDPNDENSAANGSNNPSSNEAVAKAAEAENKSSENTKEVRPRNASTSNRTTTASENAVASSEEHGTNGKRSGTVKKTRNTDVNSQNKRSENAVATAGTTQKPISKKLRQNAVNTTQSSTAVALQNSVNSQTKNAANNPNSNTAISELKPLDKDPLVYALPDTNKGANNATTAAKNADKPVDTTTENAEVAVAETNPLEQLLQQQIEKTETKTADAKLEKWQVTPNVAPVYFNSAGNGSPIHSAFAGNDKTYDRSMSVGINVNYAVNKRFAIRTGVNKLQLGYETNEVAFIASLEGQVFETTAVTPAARGVTVVNQSQMATGALSVDASLQQTSMGAMNQEFGYFEVPLEMSYKVLDTKFGINVIGGVSTLFLSENSVSLRSDSFSTSLGEATNLNDVHFSSNIGLGFQYRFFKNFELNFEPMFKYQINTFSRDAGNFRPYFIALYSGISYRF